MPVKRTNRPNSKVASGVSPSVHQVVDLLRETGIGPNTKNMLEDYLRSRTAGEDAFRGYYRVFRKQLRDALNELSVEECGKLLPLIPRIEASQYESVTPALLEQQPGWNQSQSNLGLAQPLSSVQPVRGVGDEAREQLESEIQRNISLLLPGRRDYFKACLRDWWNPRKQYSWRIVSRDQSERLMQVVILKTMVGAFKREI